MKHLKFSLAFILAFSILTFPESKASAESGWQSLGTWSMAYVVRITSADGGNLMACVNGSTDRVKFGLEKAPIWPNPVEKTTSGILGNNCATWSGISKGETYDLNKVNYRGTYHSVTVYD